MNSKKNFRAIALLTLTVLAGLVCTSGANATPPFQGKFTLPYEVQWGNATLPAGDYWLRIDYVNAATMVTIQEAESRKSVAWLLSPLADNNKNQEDGSALLIAARGGHQVVHSLRLAELGVTFVYDRALARDREMREARNTQAVPVVMAAKK